MWEDFLHFLQSRVPFFSRLRKYDVALDILHRIRPNENLGSDAALTQKSLLATQLETLHQYISQEHLIDDVPGIAGNDLRLLAADITAGRIPTTSISAALDQIEATLEIKRMDFGGGVRTTQKPTFNQKSIPNPNQAASTRSKKQQKGEDVVNLQPNDSAMLWTASEKLYGSWQFRALGMLLLAAVLLAGAGTYFIGGQTLQLRQNLENTARSATTDLQELGKSTHDTLSEESKTLISDIDRRRTQMSEALAKADQQIKELEGKSDQLQKQAINQIVQTVLEDIGGLEARLREDISSNLTKIKDNDVQALEGEVTTLRADIQQLTSGVNSGNDELNRSQPALKRLDQFSRDVTTVDNNLSAIQQARSSASDASEKANGASQSARIAADDVERMRQDLSDKIKPLSTEISTHQHELGSIQERLATLAGNTDQASSTIEQITKAIRRDNDLLKALDGRVAELQKAAADFEGRQRSASSGSTETTHNLTEDDLTADQWRQIQQALTARKFPPGRIDGTPGPRTQTAIKNFQLKAKSPSTGHLTSEQIDLLLGKSSTEKSRE